MNIVVCVKQVPNTKRINLDPRTHNIIREGIESIMNPVDANAVEAAIRLREQKGGTVTALTMGPEQAESVLQEALGMGVDRAILLCDKVFAGSDTLATGYTLATVIKELNADLVLCGQETIDGATAQVGPVIAEDLDWVQFTRVCEIKIEGDKVNIIREMRDTLELYTCKLPLVACVVDHINTPRQPILSDRIPEIVTSREYDFDPQRIGDEGSPTRVVSISGLGKNTSNFVEVDGSLPAEDRIRILMNGGITVRNNNLIRGNAKDLAELLMEIDLIKDRLVNLKESD